MIHESPAPLTVLDPDLPFLAAKAAAQLDSLILKRETDLSAVVALGKRLRESEIKTSSQSQLLDFATISVLSQAVNGASGESIQTIDDLARQASKLTEELTLSSNSSDESGYNLEKLRLFCSLLSQCATAFQHSFCDNSADFSSRD